MDALPALPLSSWKPTKDTLHLFAQIVGKVRLATAPKRNHWWHVSLRPSPLGLSTQGIPAKDGGFEIEFDFVDHAVHVRGASGAAARIPLVDGFSVADFHARLLEELAAMGVRPRILAKPYDLATKVPFAKDRRHAHYDPAAARKFAAIVAFAARTLEEFAGRFDGKTSPVQFFWHSFDLALTRFSGRRAPPLPAGATRVEREAYSHEVASFGFWPGDEDAPSPAFYAYAAPVPKDLVRHRLTPRAARWVSAEEGRAGLSYDAVRRSRDPRTTLLDFCESAFRAARTSATWPSAADVAG